MNLSDYTSVISLFLSFAVGIWQYLTQKELEKQKKKLDWQQELLNQYGIKKFEKENEDSKRADICVKVQYEEKGKYNICISNTGQAPAKDIQIDWKELKEVKGIHINEQEKLPFPLLNKGEVFSIYCLLNGLENRTPVISIKWADDFQKNNEKEFTLSF